MSLLDWLHRKLTEDLTEQRKIAVTERPPTAAGPDRFKAINNRFTYHTPTESQIKKYGSLRIRAKEFAFLIDELCPDSEERKRAQHYLDQVVMNANAAIARHEETK